MARTAKVLTDAEKAAKLKEKSDKFKELAVKRVNKAIESILIVGNLANKNTYEFDAATVEKIIGAIDGASEKVEERFKAALNGGKVKSEGFNFD